MKKISIRLLSIFITTALLLGGILSFMPITIVHAEPEKITLQLDGAPVSNDVITFEVGEQVVTATVSGTGYSWENGNLEITYTSLSDVTITLSDTFKGNVMEARFNDQVATINGDNQIVLMDIDFSEDNAPHFIIMSNGDPYVGSDTSDYNGNSTATLNYSINGVIEYTSGGGYDHGIGFRINGLRYKADESKVAYTEGEAYEMDEEGNIKYDGNNEPMEIIDPETDLPMIVKNSMTITGDTIKYDSNSDKVEFVFTMAPGTLITGLVINGQVITNLPDTAEELMACYIDHRLEIVVDNIDKASTYTIAINARYPVSSEEFMGSFLWDYDPVGYTAPDDKILNGTLEFVKAVYDGHTYTTPEEINELGGVYIWKDAERKKTYTEEREGCGEAQFPKGTLLTVKIIPDAGYQLVSFGVNGGAFAPQEEIGTYTFEVDGGPFHLQASIQQVDDVVKTTAANISRGTIDLGEEESMAVGTARLDVKDIELSDEQISNFEKAAAGYEIKNYIDISLFNTVYKGTSNQSWDTKVKDLTNDATIALELEDYANLEDIVIVHEKHDGTYEIIPINYDSENNMITFKTKSFSNYAIAQVEEEKVEYTITDENGNVIIFKNSEGHDYILTMFDYLKYSKEEIVSEFEVDPDEYDLFIKTLNKNTKEYGDLLSLYEILLTDENDREIHDGPFTIKIKMTEAMKKYNTFKIMYLDDELNVEEPIVLKVEGDYLVGTLPHLSKYALTGSVTSNPKTSDNILFYVYMFGISLIGLIILGMCFKKRIN